MDFFDFPPWCAFAPVGVVVLAKLSPTMPFQQMLRSAIPEIESIVWRRRMVVEKTTYPKEELR